MTKYESLALKLTEQIERNLQNGISKLPTEAELCSRYQISRQTVRAALALLSRQGIIVSRQGSGSYATGLSPDSLRNTIPILITSSQEYIYPHLIADIRSALSGQGYELSVYPTGNDTSKEREHLLKFLDAPPRGMIVEGCKSTLPNPNTDLYERLRASGTFILFLHNSYNGLEDNVCIKDDNYYGGCLLAEYLTTLGRNATMASPPGCATWVVSLQTATQDGICPRTWMRWKKNRIPGLSQILSKTNLRAVPPSSVMTTKSPTG